MFSSELLKNKAFSVVHKLYYFVWKNVRGETLQVGKNVGIVSQK